MKSFIVRSFATAFFLLPPSGIVRSQQNMWISGYITSWCLNMTGIPGGAGAANYGTQPYDKIDLDAMTHLIAFTAGPDSMGRMSIRTEWDGSLTWGGSLLEKRRIPFTDYIHSFGKPILCTFFSDGSQWDGTPGTWTKIMSDSSRRATCMRTIIDSIILKAQYDGVDFDLEPFAAYDTALTRTFFAELRDSLNQYHAWYDSSQKPMMTAAISNHPTFWASVANYLDQINIMTYDMYGTWCTKVWHNSPVFSGPDGKDIYGNTLASIQSKTQSYINSGIPKNKLGAGIGLNGHVWQGGTLYDDTSRGVIEPLQRWETAPHEPKYGEWMYHVLFHDYIDTATTTLRYDDVRKCPYISIDKLGSTDDIYITFEDTTTVREAIILADTMGIGGLILWDPCAAYIPTPALSAKYGIADRPGLVRDHLVQAVKQAKNETSIHQPRGPFVPSFMFLSQNFPNPFNPATIISFSVGTYGHTSLRVFDLLGREVATLVNENKPAGSYQVQWDAAGFSSGVYFYRLSVVPSARRDLVPTSGRDGQAGKFSMTKKLVLLK